VVIDAAKNAILPATKEALVKAALTACETIDAFRFEVPSVNFDMVVNKEGADRETVPQSSEALREVADRREFAFAVVDGYRGAIVVAVAASNKAKGYITVPIYFRPINERLEKLASGFNLTPTTTHILVADAEWHRVAAFGTDAAPGEDVKRHAAWETGGPLPEQIAVTTEPTVDGVPMIATRQTTSHGWSVVIWEPQTEILAEYLRMRELLLGIASAVLAVAMIGGFIAARTVTKPVLALVGETRAIGRRAWGALSPAMPRKDEIGDLSRAVRQMAEDLQIGEAEIAREAKLRGDLSRFMSQEEVDGIIEGRHPVELGGHRADVTVMFADMVAFTKAAETMPPEQVVKMLNELFTVLTEVVFRHGGIVDKFIGDCVMGIWGAPVGDPDHARRALEAAEDMMSFLEAGAEKWRESYGIEVRLAIGINSGSAIVGNIGSDKRMEYTVVGDVVNVAARLESIAAPNQVLVGESTIGLIGDTFDMRLMGERKLTGRSESVQVYELQT
jgi:class 3 adenylate cyclase/HAMP domain-containing protein